MATKTMKSSTTGKRLVCEVNQASTARHATTLRDRTAFERKPRNEGIPCKVTTTSVHCTARAIHPRSMIHDSALRTMKSNIAVKIRLRLVLVHLLLLLLFLLGTWIYAVDGPSPNDNMLVVAAIVVGVSLYLTDLSLGKRAMREQLGRGLLE